MEIDVAEIPPLAGFTSKELDPETSLYYFGARYYAKHPSDDSWSGTWLTVDPMASKYPGWSPYSCVQDNPVRFVDPNGEKIRYIGSPTQTAEMSQWVNKIGSAPVAKFIVNKLRTMHQIVTLRFGNTKASLEHGLTQKKFEAVPGTKNVKYEGSVITLYIHQKGFNDIGTTAHELDHAYQGLTQTYLAYKNGLIEDEMTLPLTRNEYYKSYYDLPVEVEARLFSTTVRSELKQMRHK